MILFAVLSLHANNDGGIVIITSNRHNLYTSFLINAEFFLTDPSSFFKNSSAGLSALILLWLTRNETILTSNVKILLSLF